MAAVAAAPGTGEGGEAAEPDSERIPGGGGYLERESGKDLQKRDLSPSPSSMESHCAARFGSQAVVHLCEPGPSLTDSLLSAGAPVPKQEVPETTLSPSGLPGEDGADTEMSHMKAGLAKEIHRKEALSWNGELDGVPEPPDLQLPRPTQDQGALWLLPPEYVNYRLGACARDMIEGPLGATGELMEVSEPHVESCVPVDEVVEELDHEVAEMEERVHEHVDVQMNATLVDSGQVRVLCDAKSPAGLEQGQPSEDMAASKVEAQAYVIDKEPSAETGGEAEVVQSLVPVQGNDVGLARAPILVEETHVVREASHEETLAREPINREEVVLVKDTAEREEVELDNAPVNGEEVEVENAPVNGEEVEVENAPVNGEEVGVENAPVNGEEVGVENAPVNGEEVGVENASVNGEEVGVENASVNGEEVGVENASVNGEEVGVENASANGEEVEVENSSVNGEEFEVENASGNGEEFEVENASGNGEEFEVENASGNGEEFEVENASGNGEEFEVENASGNGEEFEVENASGNGEEFEVENASGNGEEFEVENASGNGEEFEVENASGNGEEFEIENASVHGEGVEQDHVPVHGVGVEQDHVPVHGVGVEQDHVPVHGVGVEQDHVPVHGVGVEQDHVPVHGVGVEQDHVPVHGVEVEQDHVPVHGVGVEQDHVPVHGVGVEQDHVPVHGVGVEQDHVPVHGVGVEQDHVPVHGVGVEQDHVPVHGVGVEQDHAPVHGVGVVQDHAPVHGVGVELVQVALPDGGRPIQAPVFAVDVVLMPKEVVAMAHAPVCSEEVKLLQKPATEEELELLHASVPTGDVPLGKNIFQEVGDIEVRTLTSEEQAEVAPVPDQFESDHLKFSVSEGDVKIQGEKVCVKSQHVDDLVPDVPSRFQKLTSVKGQHAQNQFHEATQAAHVHDQNRYKPTFAGETILLSGPVLGHPHPGSVSREAETVPDRITNAKMQPFVFSRENEEVHNALNKVITQNHVLQPGVHEANQPCNPRQKEKCPKPGELINRLFEPLLKLSKPNTGEVTNELNFVHQEGEVVSRKPLQMATGLESDSASMDNDTCHESIHEQDNFSVGSALNTGPLGKGLVTSSVPMETEDHIEATSDSCRLSACSQNVITTSCRDPKEQIDVEKDSPSNPGETVDKELDVKCDTDVKLCTGEQQSPVSSPNPERQLNDLASPCGPQGAPEGFVVGGIDGLTLGSQVEVTLDHIIQDALVVSFQHGERLFSGVLMDLSKRFGPHGIPVTIHPKREYQNRPVEPVQSFPGETPEKSDENGTVTDSVSHVDFSEPCKIQSLWTSKPPPLFHEGAPYPPPLFIRDTYNQSIPQPPPRKIKRLRKRIYREEPTSIMNAIKLRPRQVLCDKCKNVVSDRRDIRKGGTDSFKQEQGKRRRHESVTTVTKKLKTDHKVNGKSQSESQKKNAVSKVSNLNHSRAKVVKLAPQTSSAKSQLHNKKVLQSKNMDHAKAREVLKMAKEKAHKRQKETSSSKNAHGKVHYTRRLQNTSSGTLPPRLRIKPQRYRNEENDSSVKKGLESLRSSKIDIKPPTRYPATRSAGEVSSEIPNPSNGPEEASSEVQNTSVCEPPGEQHDEQQTLSKRGSKSNITVYMTLNQSKADSSTASVCSSDSTDDLKSSHSECSSTENFDFPPGSMHAASSSSSSSSKEEKKLSSPLKIKVFSKNVSKCVTPDGRTICVGDIVWAKIYGFPWWPARILVITVSRKDNGLLVRQEARISWFGSPTTSFLALSQLSPFLENFQSRFNKKRKGLYRKAITEAAKAAKQLTPEVRALLTQFET